jgi:predicted RNA-binding Zn-ribbon protein involved in translation (DUF1610 family)
MTTIRTTCPRCGEVDMGPEAIILAVGRGGREGTYRFVCPTCLDPVEKRADRKIVALLVSAGVDVAERLPAEPAPREAGAANDAPATERLPAGARQAPPFSIDDVIRFHFLLQDDRSLEEFLADR